MGGRTTCMVGRCSVDDKQLPHPSCHIPLSHHVLVLCKCAVPLPPSLLLSPSPPPYSPPPSSLPAVVSFNQCSLFPASFTRKVICDWWQETVVFRVYIRLPQQRTVRQGKGVGYWAGPGALGCSGPPADVAPAPLLSLQPRLVGKSGMRLQSLLRAGGAELESVLGVHPTDLGSAFSPTHPGQTTLGTLTVCPLHSSWVPDNCHSLKGCSESHACLVTGEVPACPKGGAEGATQGTTPTCCLPRAQ